MYRAFQDNAEEQQQERAVEPAFCVRTSRPDAIGRQLPLFASAVNVLRHLNDELKQIPVVEFISLSDQLCFGRGMRFRLSAERAEACYPGIKTHLGL